MNAVFHRAAGTVQMGKNAGRFTLSHFIDSIIFRLDSLPYNLEFDDPEKEAFGKAFWEMGRMLITSIFSFSYNVFYPSLNKFEISRHNHFVA